MENSQDQDLPKPYRFEPAGPGRAIRPARILPGRGRPVVRAEDIEVFWHGPRVLPPDAMRWLVELELELFGRLTETEEEEAIFRRRLIAYFRHISSLS